MVVNIPCFFSYLVEICMAHDMYVKCLTFETFTFQLSILGFFKVPLSEVNLSQFFTSFMSVSNFNCLIIHVENLIV